MTIEYPGPVGISTAQLLHLRLKKHCGRGSSRTVEGRGTVKSAVQSFILDTTRKPHIDSPQDLNSDLPVDMPMWIEKSPEISPHRDEEL